MSTSPILQNPDTSLTADERQTVIVDPQKWTDSFARKIALQDFGRAEAYRAQNHDRRFRESDRLLTGWRPQRYWEGTRIPQANVAIFIAMQEIEVLLPRVLQVIFSDNPPFEFMPEPGSPLGAAFAVKSLLANQLRDIGNPGEFLTARELCRLAYKSSLTYGCGVIEFGWLIRQVKRIVYDRRVVADVVPTFVPQLGQMVPLPNGKTHIEAHEIEDNRIVSKPILANIDIRDYYIDPDCSSPNVQKAQYDATRTLLTIEEVKEYAGIPGFHVPDDKTLIEIANTKGATQGDTSKQIQESWRGNQWQSIEQKSADPALSKIELIRYNRKNRMVWLLGRQYDKPMYNECNPYGMLPHLNAFYTDFLGRFYGFSVCDLVEGDQKTAAEIINARLNELNLIIHAPIVRKRGMVQVGKRFHPGANWETVGDPKTDVVRMEMGAVNPAAYVEVNALSQRVQKLTGNTDVAAYGVAAEGGDSSSRTAHGVAAKQAAGNSRVEYQVENFEDQFLEPLLYILLAMNRKYQDPNSMIKLAGKDGQLITLDPLTVMNADGQFEVRASAKMRTKHSLMSGGLQMMLQTYLNPSFIQLQQQQGSTVDMANLDRMICDALDLPQQAIIRPMTPEEQQAAQAAAQAQAQQELALQQARLDAQHIMAQEGDETSLIKAILQLLKTPEIAHKLAGMPMPQEIDAMHAPKRLPNGKA